MPFLGLIAIISSPIANQGRWIKMVDTLVSYIDEPTVISLNNTHEADEVKRLLVESIGVNADGNYTEEQFQVAIDYFFYGYAFCKESGFTSLKTSTFLSIAKIVFDSDCESQTRTMNASFDAFKALVFKHAVERSPHTVGIFDIDDVTRIVDYMLNSYFRHFSLYRYIFTNKIQVSLVQIPPHNHEIPKKMAPLSAAIPQP